MQALVLAAASVGDEMNPVKVGCARKLLRRYRDLQITTDTTPQRLGIRGSGSGSARDTAALLPL